MASTATPALEFLQARVVSRAFLTPFLISTILYVVNVVLVTFFVRVYSVELSPIYGIGSMTVIYVICVFESLGLSIFVSVVSRLRRRFS